MNRLSSFAAFCAFVSGTAIAIASLFHAAANAILRLAPSPALAQLFLHWRAEAYAVALVFLAVACLLLVFQPQQGAN